MSDDGIISVIFTFTPRSLKSAMKMEELVCYLKNVIGRNIFGKGLWICNLCVRVDFVSEFQQFFEAADCQELGQSTEERIIQSFLLWLLYSFTRQQLLAGVGDRILS